uniref:Movement protein P4 n=1 Tax=Barley yellow dwarf virus-kerII TaxID=2169987 RepID=R9UHI6_9TOMB|nr:movement protein P4 [Barley yellow dwarf virus-kerII]
MSEPGAIEQFGQWLWSGPIQMDDDAEPLDQQEEEGQILYLDQQAGLRYSYSQSTILKPTPQGSSNSAPIFHNVQRFQTEFLSPTTVTRSQMSRSSLSHTRPPLQSAQCLLNSTLRAHNQPWVATLTHSPSPSREPKRLMPSKSRAKNSGRLR